MSSPEVQSTEVVGIKAVDGDWICVDEECKNVNFARRTHCNRCNKERVGCDSSKKKLGTEIGKAAAEKSRGLFSAEDWQCSKCGNVNWARRQTCNMCNAPKFCDVEERTGYGGGYNDRGVVEYKEREDSDGEYDEFGRRKKPREFKIKVKVESKKPEQPKKKSENNIINDDNEDDDDDDEDEGDLSKYALFDSDDDKTATASHSKRSRSRSKTNDKNSRSKSSSRSRSRSRTKFKNSRRSRTKSRERKYKRRSRSSSWNHRSRRRSRSKSNHKSFSKSPRNHKVRQSSTRSRSTSKGKYKDNRKYK